MKKHKTKEEKQEIITLFRTSGLSSAEFCKIHGISTTSLRNWIVRSEQTTGTKSITFVEGAKFSHDVSEDDIGIQLEYRNIKLTLPRNIDVLYLREVIQVMLYV